MLSIEEARQKILEGIAPLPPEAVDLDEALGRTNARKLVARRALPGFDNSAMDGYAVRAADAGSASPTTPARLRLTGVIGAGQQPKQPLAPGEALRIFTGAPVPEGCDAVVMQEDTEAGGDHVTVLKAVRQGANIRRAGEDLRPGDLLLEMGAVIGPGDIAAFATQGYARLEVVRRPTVAILPTGDELVDIGREPGPGQVANSNAHMLAAQVRAAGAVPHVQAIVPDEPKKLDKALRRAALADVILTSGGVSVGDFDYVRNVAERAGHLDFWKVDMKPGKPLAYGRVEGRPFVGLPGNPVSSFVGFVLFVAPLLRRLGGQLEPIPPRRRARLSAPLRPDKARRELVRGQLRVDAGELWVVPSPRRGSHQVSSLIGTTALIDTPPGTDELAVGTLVDVISV